MMITLAPCWKEDSIEPLNVNWVQFLSSLNKQIPFSVFYKNLRCELIQRRD